MKLAKIENNIVTNVILVDPDNIPEWAAEWPDITEVENAGIGWTYDGENFSEPPEPPVDLELLAAQVRIRRDRLLLASDWTQVADAPVDQAAWATYRQALRDIPQQDGFPTNITWPTKP